jgi:hypothetical protein
MTFASLMAGISIAVERVVEMLKGIIPPLANPWPKNDQVRAGILQLLAAAVGAVIVSQMPNQVKAAMPPGLNVSLNWTTYAVLGLISSGGSAAWNHVLDILGALKKKQETLAGTVAAAAAGAAGGTTPAGTPGATVTPATTIATPPRTTGAQVGASTGFAPVAKAATAGVGFLGATTVPPTAATPPAAAPVAPRIITTTPVVPPSPVSSPASSPTSSPAPATTLPAPPAAALANPPHPSASATSVYPGRVVSTGDSDPQAVRLIQHRLNQVGCGPVDEDGIFGQQTKQAVELYQMRSADHFGLPLQVDGAVGPLTWYSLFATPEIPPTWLTPSAIPAGGVDATISPLLAATLKFAAGEVGVMEDPLGSNRGPRVDQYLRSTGIDPTKGSFPWCAAFVYFCFQQAAAELGLANPVIKTDGVLVHWDKAGLANIRRLDAETCVANPSLVRPGMIFVIIHPSGAGHTGLVEKVNGNFLTTIEGNTNLNGSREGIGVFRRNQRTIASINRGFISY